MGTAMLSLMATVVVLFLHHRNELTPVPIWLRRCLNLKIVAQDTTDEHPTLEDLEIKKSTNEPTDFLCNVLKLQCRILHTLMKDRKNPKKQNKGPWQVVAGKLNSMLIFVFLAVNAVTNLVVFATIVHAT